MQKQAFPVSVDEVLTTLAAHDYVCDRRLATALFLALRLERPLFLEGEAGAGQDAGSGTVGAADPAAVL